VKARSAGLSIDQNIRAPREGWDVAFRKMALAGDDRLLDGDLASTSRWDESEWQW